MATVAKPIAKCFLRWIYEQSAEVLRALKNFLLGIISQIDIQIAALRAWLAQHDFLAKKEQLLWDTLKQVEEEIKNSLTSFMNGPDARLCPEFYEYILDPAQYLFQNATTSLSAVRERYHDIISYMGIVDGLILYWEQIKTDLLNVIDIIDDALFVATQEASEIVP